MFYPDIPTPIYPCSIERVTNRVISSDAEIGGFAYLFCGDPLFVQS